MQRPGDCEFGPGEFFVWIGRRHVGWDRFVRRNFAGLHPCPDRVEEGTRLSSVELQKDIGAVFGGVGSDDDTLFIDPNDGGNIDHAVAMRHDVLRVDHTRMGWIRLFDERARVIARGVERGCDRHKTFVTKFFVKRLPHGQIFSAASPGCIGDEEYLLAAKA